MSIEEQLTLVEEFKQQEETAPRGLLTNIIRGGGLITLIPAIPVFLLRYSGLSKNLPNYQPHEIPSDFAGINIAPGPDESFDDWLIDRLKELGVPSVRIDYGYTSDSQIHAARLIPKLHENGFRILLHLVQPVDDAWTISKSEVNGRWEKFVDDTLTQFAGKITEVELASTINRFSWTGYSVRGFIRAVKTGAAVCDRHGIPWFGPNVSDFSPMYNIGILSRLSLSKLRPAAHTDNLFVDRGGQPENNDSKVFNLLSDKLDFDLVGKARFLKTISSYYSIEKTISTYNYWTLDIKSNSKPRYVTTEQYARYLYRYMVLGAASGHLDRIYWGQMVSHAKGLIADNSGIKPRIPTVHHCWLMHGKLDGYEIRPGFHALAAVTRSLSNARFVHRLTTNNNTFAFEFESTDATDQESEASRWIIAWTRDNLMDSLGKWFGDDVHRITSVEDMYGNEIESRELSIGMEPIRINYRGSSVAENHERDTGTYLGRILTPVQSEFSYRVFSKEKFRGIVRDDVFHEDFQDSMEKPEQFFKKHGVRIVKNSDRNKLGEIRLSTRDGERPFFLKAFKSQKKFSDLSRSRSFKAWNNICQYLYRDIKTPHPVAILEDVTDPLGSVCYLLTEKAENTIVARSLLDCIRQKTDLPFEGMSHDEFLTQLGTFVRRLHRSGILHRDLTGGNILVGNELVDGKLDFTIIDLARTRFYRRVPLLCCLMELSRVRLHSKDRKKFFLAYVAGNPKKFKRLWWLFRLCHFYYRTKYRLKKPKRFLKDFRRR